MEYSNIHCQSVHRCKQINRNIRYEVNTYLAQKVMIANDENMMRTTMALATLASTSLLS